MVDMAVCHQDMAHRLAAEGSLERLEMGWIGRARIHDRDRAVPDDEAVGTRIGEGAGVIADDAPDERAQRRRHAIVGLQRALELDLIIRHTVRLLVQMCSFSYSTVRKRTGIDQPYRNNPLKRRVDAFGLPLAEMGLSQSKESIMKFYRIVEEALQALVCLSCFV